MRTAVVTLPPLDRKAALGVVDARVRRPDCGILRVVVEGADHDDSGQGIAEDLVPVGHIVVAVSPGGVHPPGVDRQMVVVPGLQIFDLGMQQDSRRVHRPTVITRSHTVPAAGPGPANGKAAGPPFGAAIVRPSRPGIPCVVKHHQQRLPVDLIIIFGMVAGIVQDLISNAAGLLLDDVIAGGRRVLAVADHERSDGEGILDFPGVILVPAFQPCTDGLGLFLDPGIFWTVAVEVTVGVIEENEINLRRREFLEVEVDDGDIGSIIHPVASVRQQWPVSGHVPPTPAVRIPVCAVPNADIGRAAVTIGFDRGRTHCAAAELQRDEPHAEEKPGSYGYAHGERTIGILLISTSGPATTSH